MTLQDILDALQSAGFEITKGSTKYLAERHTSKNADSILITYNGKTFDVVVNGKRFSQLSGEDVMDEIAHLVQVKESLDLSSQGAVQGVLNYALFLKIIRIATTFNQQAFLATQRQFTSVQQLIVHLKSLYITNAIDRKYFNQALMDELDINTDTFVSESLSINEAKNRLLQQLYDSSESFSKTISALKLNSSHDVDIAKICIDNLEDITKQLKTLIK